MSLFQGCLVTLVLLILIGSCFDDDSSSDSSPLATTDVALPTSRFTVIREWSIPNGGRGQALLLRDSALTMEMGASIADAVVASNRAQRNAFIFIYKSERAARMQERMFSLTPAEERHYNANFIGDYTKNANTGYHRFDWYPKGINGPSKSFSF